MPNQRINKGTQAIEGMLRNDWKSGSSSSRVNLEKPVTAPKSVAANTPVANPIITRKKVLSRCCSKLPSAINLETSDKIWLGLENRLRSIRPFLTEISQAAIKIAGSSKARTAGLQRAHPGHIGTGKYLVCAFPFPGPFE